MNPGYQGKEHHVRDWNCVKENLTHPSHLGVVGDLMYHRVTGAYQLWEYLPPPQDRYDRHAVPHAWGKQQHQARNLANHGGCSD